MTSGLNSHVSGTGGWFGIPDLLILFPCAKSICASLCHQSLHISQGIQFLICRDSAPQCTPTDVLRDCQFEVLLMKWLIPAMLKDGG